VIAAAPHPATPQSAFRRSRQRGIESSGVYGLSMPFVSNTPIWLPMRSRRQRRAARRGEVPAPRASWMPREQPDPGPKPIPATAPTAP
jgi:hypothetical protein